MRLLPALLIVCFTAHATLLRGQVPERSPELARRADSLSRLDPAIEVRKAIRRGDHRLVAVCGYACVPPGVDLHDSLVRGAMARLRRVEGTSDFVANVDVARLNKVSGEYAARYNQLLLAALRRRSGSRLNGQ
jgi:hypothetical protein